MILVNLLILAALYILLTYYQKQMFRLIGVLSIPFVKIYLSNRVKKGKEDKSRKTERFGIPSVTRPKGQLIWIHAVSVGEVLSIIPFIEEFKKINENINILLTTTTLTSAKIVRDLLGDTVIHQFAPFDIFLWDRRFIKYWKPKSVFFVESELWPNILFYLYEKDVPTYLLNVRVSSKSLKRLYLAKKIFKVELFSLFTKILAPSSELKIHVRDLGARNVDIVPNIKMFSKKLNVNSENVKNLKDKIKDRECWIAVSSHKGEEKIILDAHKLLKEIYPNMLTFIAVRHPNRGAEVKNLCSAGNFSSALYSEDFKNKDTIESDIYIIDEIGNLGDFFETISTVLVCGSLIDGIGGHNILEPMRFMCNVATGPYIENFKDIFIHVEDRCKKVSNEQEIKDFVDSSLRPPAKKIESLEVSGFFKLWSNAIKQFARFI